MRPLFPVLKVLREPKTVWLRETRAGAVTFFAMAYIIFANPAILSAAGIPFEGAVVSTCFVAGLMCILMGAFTNYPLCIAAGMGLNAAIAFTLVQTMGVTWQAAMGVVVLEGIIVLALSASTLRSAFMDAIPASLKHSIAAGIGMFITFIGLQNGNLVQSHPATLVTFTSFSDPVTLLTAISLLITAMMIKLRVQGALLLGIIATAALALLPIWPTGAGRAALISVKGNPFALPTDWSTFFQADLKGALSLQLIPFIFAFLMADFFDTFGSSIAVGTKAEFLDERGRIPLLRRVLVVDSLGAIAGGAAGCSSNTCYIESAAGAAEGGRTGLTAVVCGLLFWLSLFMVPLIAVIGGGIEVEPGVFKNPVTAASLMLVGFFMMESVRHIDWTDPAEGIPAFAVLAYTPLTFSISHGIGAGIITYVILQVAAGKIRQISPLLWITAALFVLVFVM